MLLSFRSSFDIITLGSATQDLFLRSPALEEVPDRDAPDGLEVCLPFGAKIDVKEMHTTSGGGATNAAVTFSRYGLKTGCICRVGKDQFAANILDELTREKISTRFVQQDETRKTACSVILLSGSGHRAILTHRGASAHLSGAQIPWSSLRTPWFYLTSVAGDLTLLKQVFTFAQKQHIRIAWNPGKAELEAGLRKLSPFLKQTSVLLVNREEAALVTELPPRHLGKIFQKLGRYPSQATMITDGQKGAYAQEKQDKQIIFAPILPTHRINTTGAGDAFGSACVASLLHGRSLEEAMKVGVLNATSVVSHMGAKTGVLKHFPSLTEARVVHTSRIALLSL